MTVEQMVLIGIVFIAATFAAMITLTQLAPNRLRQRLANEVDVQQSAMVSGAENWITTATRLAGPFARLSLPTKGWDDSPLRVQFMNAGYRSRTAPMLFFAAKTILALALPAALLIGLQLAAPRPLTDVVLAFLLLLAAFGYYLPNMLLRQLAQRRQLQIFESFPDAADLMLVCVESGLGLDSALQRVADEMRLKSQPIAEELQLLNLEMRAGSTREKSLRNLALRTGVDEVGSFATMLIQADRFGTSIGNSLRVFSVELRTRRQFKAEELATKIPLKLLFPLVFFIFPSLLLVLLGPAFIQVYRVLLPTLAGQ